ncbi:MAG: hypothetical protein ACRDOB_03110 [Streptosporangiaceae bacterium]
MIAAGGRTAARRLGHRVYPILGAVGLIVAGLAGTIWGPRYYGQTAWAVPDDLWATLVAAQRLLHLNLAGLYTPPTNLVSFPGTALILVPVAALIDVAGLPLQTGADIQLRAGSQIGNHAEWLILGPCVVILSAVALFAADALAERMAVSQFKRFLLAAASATALWNVTIRWGHPEDAVAVGLLLYAVLALANGKPGRAAWLAGAAVAVQPLVLLAFPFLLVTVEPRRLAGFVTRAVVPTLVLLGAAAAANWPATVHAVTSQPNAPTVDHPTPWIYLTALAPHLSNGSVAAGPARALSIVVACGCALATWRRWRTARLGDWSPDTLQELLWWVAFALALRSAFEPVMVSYYVWPPLAAALVAASRSYLRLIPAGLAAGGLTFLSQSSWRNPFLWWTPMVAVLGLTLLLAWPRGSRSAPAQVQPEPGEQFVADSAP